MSCNTNTNQHIHPKGNGDVYTDKHAHSNQHISHAYEHPDDDDL
jgi:hypothetical protein